MNETVVLSEKENSFWNSFRMDNTFSYEELQLLVNQIEALKERRRRITNHEV